MTETRFEADAEILIAYLRDKRSVREIAEQRGVSRQAIDRRIKDATRRRDDAIRFLRALGIKVGSDLPED